MDEHQYIGGRAGEVRGDSKIVPRTSWLPDSTFRLLREGYLFISRGCDRAETDVFRTRLMLRSVICMRGEAAARLFYGDEDLTRVGAMPQTVLRLLQDKGSVQQLDGALHRARKAMFIRLLMQDEAGIARLIAIFRECWLAHLADWVERPSIHFSSAVAQVLADAAFRWCGIPDDPDLRQGSTLSEMVEQAGHFGPRTWRALYRRSVLESRLETLFVAIRAGSSAVREGSPCDVISRYTDEAGHPLTERVAAVELINVLRPIVAVSKYVVFAALRLHQNETWCRLFETGQDDLLDDFVEEVRRISPFFPFVGAVAKRRFSWEGYRIDKGQWLLLDLYGTCHDPRLFFKPGVFRPQRQLTWQSQPFRHIPQGAGDAARTHRCPGERIAVELVKEAVCLLCREMEFDIPPQDLTISLANVPAGPRSGLIFSGVVRKDPQ